MKRMVNYVACNEYKEMLISKRTLLNEKLKDWKMKKSLREIYQKEVMLLTGKIKSIDGEETQVKINDY